MANDTQFIEKISIPAGTFDLRDKGGRELIKELSEKIAGGITFIVAWDGKSTPVPANIPAGVSVVYNDVTYTGTLSAETTGTGVHAQAGAFYLVSCSQHQHSEKDVYAEYVPIGNEGSKTWERLGDTSLHDIENIENKYSKATGVSVLKSINSIALADGTVTLTKGDAVQALTSGTAFTTTVTPATTKINVNRTTDASVSTTNAAYLNGLSHTVKYLTTDTIEIPSVSISYLDTTNITKYNVATEKSSYISENANVIASYISGYTEVSVPSVTAGADATASYITSVDTATIYGVTEVTAKTASYISAISTDTMHKVTANSDVTASKISNVATTSLGGSVMTYTNDARNWNINYDTVSYTLSLSYVLFGSTSLPSTVVTGVTHSDVAASKITSTANTSFVTGITAADVATSSVTADTQKTFVTAVNRSNVVANKTTLGTANKVKSIAWTDRTASKITAADTTPSKVTTNGTQTVAIGTVSAEGSGAGVAIGSGPGSSITFATGALDTTSTSNGAVETGISYTTGNALISAAIGNQPVFGIASGTSTGVDIVTGITSTETSASGVVSVLPYNDISASVGTEISYSVTSDTVASNDAVSYSAGIVIQVKASK